MVKVAKHYNDLCSIWVGQDCIFQEAREKDIAEIEIKNVEHLNGRIACLNWKERPYLKNVMQKT